MNPNMKTYDIILAADPHDAEEHHRITNIPRGQIKTFDGVRWGALRGEKPRRMYWTQDFQTKYLQADFWAASQVREAVYWRALATKEQRDDAVVVPFDTWYEYEETPLEREAGKWQWVNAITAEQLEKATDAADLIEDVTRRGCRALTDAAHEAGVDIYPKRIQVSREDDQAALVTKVRLVWTPLPGRERGLKTTRDYQVRMGLPDYAFRALGVHRRSRKGARLDQW